MKSQIEAFLASPRIAFAALLASGALLALHRIGVLPGDAAFQWATWAVLLAASATIAIRLCLWLWACSKPLRHFLWVRVRRLTWDEAEYLYQLALLGNGYHDRFSVGERGGVQRVIDQGEALCIKGLIEVEPLKVRGIPGIRATPKGMKYAREWAEFTGLPFPP